MLDLQDAGFVQRRIAQIVVARRLMSFQPDLTAAPPPPLSAPPAALPEDTEPPPKPALPPPPPTPPPPTTTPKADEADDTKLTPDEEFNRRVNATGYDGVNAIASRGMPRSAPKSAVVRVAGAKMNPSSGSVSGKAAAAALAAAAAAAAARAEPVAGKGDGVVEEKEEVDEDEEAEGCILEENPIIDMPVAALWGVPNPKAKKTMEVDDDDDDDDDGCMLEDNPTDGAPARKSAEVNDDDEGEDGCILEENQVART